MSSLALHGFLGGASDWEGIASHAIDLPLALPGADNIAQYSEQLWQLLPHKPTILIGYSMGARIGMHWLPRVKRAIFIAGHPGDAGNDQRLIQDQRWQARFASEPLEQVLDAWYDQPVFSGGDNRATIARRYRGQGAALGQQLLTLSVARQEWQPLHLTPVLYVTGDRDRKYCELGRQLAKRYPNLCHRIISDAGHNCLLDQPEQLKQLIEEQI